MAWIESHQAVGQHPKTIHFAALLHISLPAAVGHLHYLWWWALDFAPTGSIKRASAAVVAKACLWRGDPNRFWNALVNSGFVDASEEGGVLHDWYDYAGRLIEKRNANASRMRSKRAAHVQHTFETRAGATNRTNLNQPTLPPYPPSDPRKGEASEDFENGHSRWPTGVQP